MSELIEVKFYLKDEFGQETETKKTYTEDCTFDGDVPLIQIMVEDFVNHLRSCGYAEKVIEETLTLAMKDGGVNDQVF